MKISDLHFCAKLYGVHRIARRSYRSYEHLARDVPFQPEMQVRLDVYAQPRRTCAGSQAPEPPFAEFRVPLSCYGLWPTRHPLRHPRVSASPVFPPLTL